MKKNNLVGKEIYIAPNMEVMQIETEQNVLSSGSGELPSMTPDYW